MGASRRRRRRREFSSLPPVLVPRLHLRLGEVERVGHVAPVRHRQVLLAAELPLQEGQLRVREGRPPAPRLAALGALAGRLRFPAHGTRRLRRRRRLVAAAAVAVAQRVVGNFTCERGNGQLVIRTSTRT